MNKKTLIKKINQIYNDVQSSLTEMYEGERSYSEMGEYFSNVLGENILSVLDKVKENINK